MAALSIGSKDSYYSINFFNQSDEPVICSDFTKLDVDLFNRIASRQLNIAVARLRVPTDLIPLSQHSIPFREWAFGISNSADTSDTNIKWSWVKTNGEKIGSFYRVASGFDAINGNVKIIETTPTNTSSPVRTIAPAGAASITLVPCNFEANKPFNFFLYFDDGDVTGTIYCVTYDDQDLLVTTPTVVYTANKQILAVSVNPINGGLLVITNDNGTHVGFRYFDYAGSRVWNTTDTANSGVLTNIDITQPEFTTLFCATMDVTAVGAYGIICCLGNLYYFLLLASTTTATAATLPTDTKAVSPSFSPLGDKLHVLGQFDTIPPPTETMYLFGMTGTKNSQSYLLDMLAVKNSDTQNVNYQPPVLVSGSTPMCAVLLHRDDVSSYEHNPWKITKANSNSLIVGMDTSPKINKITYRYQTTTVAPPVYTTGTVWPTSNNHEGNLNSPMPADTTLHRNYANGVTFMVSPYRTSGQRPSSGSLAPDPSSWIVARTFVSYAANNVDGSFTSNSAWGFFQTNESAFPTKHLSLNFADVQSSTAGALTVYGYENNLSDLQSFNNDLLNREVFSDNLMLFSTSSEQNDAFVQDFEALEVPKPFTLTWERHGVSLDLASKTTQEQGYMAEQAMLGTFFGYTSVTTGTMPGLITDTALLSKLIAAFGMKKASFYARFNHASFWANTQKTGTIFAPFPTYPMRVIGNTVLFPVHNSVNEFPPPAEGVTFASTAICAHRLSLLPTQETNLTASSMLATRSDYGFPFSNGFQFTSIDITQDNKGNTLVGFSMANEHYTGGPHDWTTAAGGRMYYRGCALLNPYTGQFIANNMQVSSSSNLFGNPNPADGFGSTPGHVFIIDANSGAPSGFTSIVTLVVERIGCPDANNNTTMVQSKASVWQTNFHLTDNSLTTYARNYDIPDNYMTDAVDICVFSDPSNQVAMNWVLIAKATPGGGFRGSSCVGWQLDASQVYGSGGQPYHFYIHPPWDTDSDDLTIIKVQAMAKNPLQAPLVMMRIVGTNSPYARDVLYAIQTRADVSVWHFELVPLIWKDVTIEAAGDTAMTLITPYDASFSMMGSYALLSNPTKYAYTDKIGNMRAMSVNPYDATMAYVQDNDADTTFSYTSAAITEILDNPQVTWDVVNVNNPDYGSYQTPFKIYDFQPADSGGGGGGVNQQRLLTYVASSTYIDPSKVDYANPNTTLTPQTGLTIYGYFSSDSSGNELISGSEDGLGAMYSFAGGAFTEHVRFPSLTAPLTGYTPAPVSSRPGPDQTVLQYQEYVNAFNDAIASIVLPSSWNITKPYMKVDTINRVFYVTLPYDFSGSTSSTSYRLHINDNLQQILDMPLTDAHTLTPSSDGDVQFFEVSTKRPFTTANSSYDIMQEGRSFGKLFDIARIFVESPGLPVAGTLEGSNSNVQCITDIFPDVDTLTPGAALIYQPFFDRWYTMTQRDPVQRVNVQIKYQTRSGEIYPISVSPGDFWGILLVFRRIADL